MYASFYFPVSDFRDLSKTATVRRPRWPVFFDKDKPFQQNLGIIKDRPRGGIRGWVQEGSICEVRRSIEIDSPHKIRSIKRFYFDGTFSGYFSIGISGIMTASQRSFDREDLFKIINDISKFTIKSRHLQGAPKFSEFGEFAAQIYQNGTTISKRGGLNQQYKSKWVMNSRPIAIFEMPSDRISSSLKHSEAQTWRFMQNQIRFLGATTALNNHEGSTFPTVIIEKNSRSEDKFARQARMVLARLYCEFCLLQDSVLLLSSDRNFELNRDRSEYFCERMSESLSRVIGSKRLSALRDPAFYSLFTNIFLDSFDASRIDALAHGLDVHGARQGLRQLLLRSHLWSRIANEEQFKIVKEKIMGSKYVNTGVAGAMGDNASADQSTFSQNVGVNFSPEEMSELSRELESLKGALLEINSTDALVAAAAVSQAKDAADSQDSSALSLALKNAGKWAFDVATKIGVTVAAAAIKKAAGL